METGLEAHRQPLDLNLHQNKRSNADGASVPEHPKIQEHMNDGKASERELLRRGQKGDRDALAELWRANRRWVAAITLAHRPRTIDVEDIMQEVAIKFISRLDTLRDLDAFRPWLRRIVINICRGAARGQKHTLQLSTGATPSDFDDDGSQQTGVAVPEAHENTSDEQMETTDAAKRLLEQAMSLPPEYREPLLLRCVRGMSYQQIGDVLELPVTTIETRLARARRMLREEVMDDVWSE